MVNRLMVASVFIACALWILSPSSNLRARVETSGTAPSRPKLIVMITIDQFPYSYLVRFRPYFVKGGFNLLLQGANFINCRYDDAITVTCPGHAVLSTGAYPAVNGIVGNDWYDRSLHRTVNCVEDDATALVGGTAGTGRSPGRLIGDTFSDELRLQTDFKSRVISISLKDRGAIIPGGHTANAAYWYDIDTGHFVSSTYYMRALPAWVESFNDLNPAKALCETPWQALPETPGAAGKTIEDFNRQPGEPCPDRRFLEWLNNTPYMSQIQLNFARLAIQEEHLGLGPSTDLLAVSLSENDHIGHEFGPYSPQVADMTLRTDRDLADFFHFLDRAVGLENVWITLSADHGVAPTPSFVEENRLGPGTADEAAVALAVSKALAQEFGPGDWVTARSEFQLYLNREELAKRGINTGRAEFVAAEAAAGQPNVVAAFSRTQIMTGNLPETPLARKVAHSFNPHRSGDVYFVLAPYAVPILSQTGSTHGSPWSYDAQVPLIFWGGAFRPGVYGIPAQPIDLSATLSVAMGLAQPSGSAGNPLTIAIK